MCSGALAGALLAIAQDVKDRGGLDQRACFIDGTFVPTKNGRWVGKTKRGEDTKFLGVADHHGLSIAICTTSDSPAEVKLLARTVDERFVADVHKRLIGDKACDSDGLDHQMMQEYSIEVTTPHRCKRRRQKVTQDGRALRRCARRWKIERLFAWFGSYRRLVVRWEYHGEDFPGSLYPAFVFILLTHLWDGF